jgi:hypothetical protein
MSQDQKPLSLKESFDKVRAYSAQAIAVPFMVGTAGVGTMNYVFNQGEPLAAIALGAAFLGASLGGCYWFDKKAKQVANAAIARQENTPR